MDPFSEIDQLLKLSIDRLRESNESKDAHIMNVISNVISLLDTANEKFLQNQKEKEYIETILNGIKHRIFLIDRDYKILRLNKAALRDNTDLDEVIGTYCYKRFEERTSPCDDCPATDTFRIGDVVHVLRGYPKGGGNEIIFKISSYPVSNNRGEIMQAVISARDVTEVQRVEQIKNDLMKMLAHDIRNPLLAITQTLDNCLNGRIHYDLIGETRDNCELLLNMIDDILDIYRHESHKFIISKKEVNILRTINSAVKLVDTLTKDKKIKIKLRVPESIPTLTADENRLIRVMINLLENAIMYSPKSGKISVVAAVDQKSSPNALRVSVSDQGIGISKKDLERIFGRYYRVERRKTEGRTGLGLGLTFCRQTIEAHGGKIWAESPAYKGKGSRFVFTLPVLQQR